MMDDLPENGSEFDAAERAIEEEEDPKKSCADCGTTKTPLWRGGPAGPKSLCNACGIRSRKKRPAFLGLNRGRGRPRAEEKKMKKSGSSGPTKRRMVMLQRSTVEEELEQAAVLLLALSMHSRRIIGS